MKNIGVKGAYGEKNFGDDAIMYFLYQWFEKKKVDVTFIGKHNNYVAKLFPKSRYILKSEEHNHNFDLIILGGGTQAFSFSNTTKTSKIIRFLKLLVLNPKNGFYKITKFIEKRLGKTHSSDYSVIGLGIGFGPFLSNTKIQGETEKLINEMDILYVRDSLSFEFSLPHNKKSYLYTDICYLPKTIDFSLFTKERDQIESIGVIVRDWGHDKLGNKYYQNLQIQIQKLRIKGYMVQYILFRDEDYWIKHLEKTNEKYIIWQPKKQRIEEFVRILGNFDLFISARFHGVIFGALLGIPSISIEVEQKLALVSKMIYGNELVWRQPFNSHELEELLSKSHLEYHNLIDKIKESNTKNMHKCNLMFEDLWQNLL